MSLLTRRHLLATGAAAAIVIQGTRASLAAPAMAWGDVLAKAKGSTVYWNAWGGDDRINAFIATIGDEAKARYGVSVTHVKLKDTAEAVTRVIAEKTAGRNAGGGVDLIWINGPNLLALKSQKLLYGPFAQDLPNWQFVDTETKVSNVIDFTLPVEGYASPWRIAQMVYVYDSARSKLDTLPRSVPAMLTWAEANKGRLSHPSVRNFLGATFLKQALYELSPERSVLAKPADDAGFATAVAPLWAWYDKLRPNLWRAGMEFPENGPAHRQLLADGAVDLAISFNPAEAATAIAAGQLPDTARVYTLSGGTIGNTSFVAIPYNAASPHAAMVVANLILEPEIQARAQDPREMGSVTVLDLRKLSAEARAAFTPKDRSPALPTNEELGPVLPEPHSSWMTKLTTAFEQRYAG